MSQFQKNLMFQNGEIQTIILGIKGAHEEGVKADNFRGLSEEYFLMKKVIKIQ